MKHYQKGDISYSFFASTGNVRVNFHSKSWKVMQVQELYMVEHNLICFIVLTGTHAVISFMIWSCKVREMTIEIICLITSHYYLIEFLDWPEVFIPYHAHMFGEQILIEEYVELYSSSMRNNPHHVIPWCQLLLKTISSKIIMIIMIGGIDATYSYLIIWHQIKLNLSLIL